MLTSRTVTKRHPLLVDAEVWLRAERWSGSGVWPNDGSSGSTLDATAVNAPFKIHGEPCGWFGGQTTHAATCPDAAALDLTSGFVVWVDMEADWQPSQASQILAKPQTGDPDTNDCYAVGFDTSGHPFVEWQDAVDGHVGPAFLVANGATADVTFADGVARRQIGFEWLSTAQGYTARFYTGTPDSYTLVSEIVNTTVGAQTITTSTDGLRVGDPITGAIYRLRLYGTLGGALLREYYPARDYSSGSTMNAPTGETWSNVLVCREPGMGIMPGYFTVPDNAALDVNPTTTSLTVAVVATSPNWAGASDFIPYAAKVSATGTGWVMASYGLAGGLIGLSYEAGSPTAIDAGTAPTDGNKALFVMRFDAASDDLEVAVNGTLTGSAANTAGVGDLGNTVAMNIGRLSVSDVVARCIIHKVATWDRALTDSEVALLATVL